MPSTRRATWRRASPMPSFRSPAKGIRTGVTPGCPWWALVSEAWPERSPTSQRSEADSARRPMKTRPAHQLEIRGRNVRLGERTLIMGVLNVTPDSFSDPGLYFGPDRADRAIRHGLEMVRQGADWIDVGGESTRPGARPVPAEEELGRVLPVIRGLRRKLPSVAISIDTTKAEVAEQGVRAGATILNDVSGLRFDARLAD